MFVFAIFLFSASLALARNITTVVHESGHALAGLILYDGKLSIYIGSYGDPEKGIHFKFGRFAIHFKYNLFLWNHGLCRAETDSTSLTRSFIFALAGPLMSLLFAIPCFFVFTSETQNDYFKTACFIFFLSSIIDFFQNIYPNKEAIILHNGSVIYNDGQSLKNIILFKRMYKFWTKLSELYNSEQYEAGVIYFESLKNKHHELLRMGMLFYICVSDFKKAKVISEQLNSLIKFNANDYYNTAIIYSNTGDYDKAIENYGGSIELNPENYSAYNNRGYYYIMERKYEKALHDLDKCIELNPEFAFAYNNRGFAKIKSGEPEQGLTDIRKSLALDGSNAYAYRNLGIYYFEKNEFMEALNQFKKAKELDANVPENEEYLAKTEFELNKTISS